VGDPGGELDEFEVAAAVLEVGGAEPEVVGEEATESAEGDGGEGGCGGKVVGGWGLGEVEVVALAEEGAVEAGGGEKGENCGGEGEEDGGGGLEPGGAGGVRA
jgi:hypothetical protein